MDMATERRVEGEGTFLGTNKEVFDAEVYAIREAARLLDKRGEVGQSYTVFSDSQAAIYRVLHEGCGPAQPRPWPEQ